MTTPTGGEWMSAYEALQFLTPSYIPRRARADAARAICTRAHAGLIKVRAKLFIFQDKEETDVEVPREFWWAKGEEVDLTQDWASGDFETFLNHTSVRLQAFGVEFERQDIERMKPASAANPTPSPAGKPAGRTVFIGHGHSEEWRKLYIFLQKDHDLGVIEFNSSSPAGISTTDHLQGMLDQADFAFLILTAEDEQATGEFNPRMNVVHEAGLFQGKLGFRKAILFLEEGCREFSNVRGLTHIPFARGKIEAQFHEATRGHCHAASRLRSHWRPDSQADAENQLCGLPIPARDHSTVDLALPPVHAQPARRRRFVGGTWCGRVLRDHSALGEPFRTDDRGRPAKASSEASCDLASRRGLSENRRPHGLSLAGS